MLIFLFCTAVLCMRLSSKNKKMIWFDMSSKVQCSTDMSWAERWTLYHVHCLNKLASADVEMCRNLCGPPCHWQPERWTNGGSQFSGCGHRVGMRAPMTPRIHYRLHSGGSVFALCFATIRRAPARPPHVQNAWAEEFYHQTHTHARTNPLRIKLPSSLPGT